MRFLTAFILTLCLSSCFSTPSDSSKTHLISGIYATFEEFRDNNPSVKMEVQACIGKAYVEIAKNDYQLCMHTKMKGTIPPKIFGFCDGAAVYICPDKKIYPSHKSGFLKLENVNIFSAYYELSTEVIASRDLNTQEDIATLMVISKEDGSRKRLHSKDLKRIMADDAELLYYFNQERQKHDQLLFYLLQYYDRKLHGIPHRSQEEEEDTDEEHDH